MQTDLLTVKEVAEFFRVCEQTVRNWIKGIFYDKGQARTYKGPARLKAIKVGNKFLIKRTDMIRFQQVIGC